MRRWTLAILVCVATACGPARFEHRHVDGLVCEPAAAMPAPVSSPAPADAAAQPRTGSGDVLVDVAVAGVLGESMRTELERELVARGYRVLTPTRAHPIGAHEFAITGRITPPSGRIVVTHAPSGTEIRVMEFQVHPDDLVVPLALPSAVADTVLDRQHPPPPGPTGLELACLIEPLDCEAPAARPRCVAAANRITRQDRPRAP
jgi:hypothetical protein